MLMFDPNIVEVVTTLRVCNYCGLRKPLEDFPPRGGRICAVCDAIKDIRRVHHGNPLFINGKPNPSLGERVDDVLEAVRLSAQTHCMFCKRTPHSRSRREKLVVDHCHWFGIIRDRLCHLHNSMVADIELWGRVIREGAGEDFERDGPRLLAYIMRHAARPTPQLLSEFRAAEAAAKRARMLAMTPEDRRILWGPLDNNDCKGIQGDLFS